MNKPGTTVDVVVPGSVWYDTLDPHCSDMEEELGLRPLRATAFSRRVGKGIQFRYWNVPVEIAMALADYIGPRGEMLLGQGYDGDDAARATARRAVKLAGEIRAAVARAAS